MFGDVSCIVSGAISQEVVGDAGDEEEKLPRSREPRVQKGSGQNEAIGQDKLLRHHTLRHLEMT